MATKKRVRTKLKSLPKVHKTQESVEVGTFPLNHYSYSSLVKFTSNPILFKVQYLNKDRFDTTRNISGVIGTAFHKAMEVYYGGVSELKPTNEAEAMEYALKAGMGLLEGYSDGFINYSSTIPNKQKALDRLSFSITSYVQELNYGDAQYTVEVEADLLEHVRIDWKGQVLELPVKLKGYVDRIELKDDKLRIIDYKTCTSFSNPDKIDGAKIIQAVQYYLLVYARYGKEPYSMVYEEVKGTKNRDGSSQVRRYEIVYAENELYFDFYFRLYEDVTKGINGQMVYVPNVHTLFDNEVAIISYIHRLDMTEEKAELMKKHKVDNLTDLLKKQIQNANNMQKLMQTLDKQFVSAKTLNYEKMQNHEKIQTKMMEHGMMMQFHSKIDGATVDLYQYTPSIGLKMSRIENYTADVEQVLGVSGIRVLAPIPNSTMIGYEVPRSERQFPTPPSPSKSFDLAIGQTIMGATKRFDIRKSPHMLVAGATGSGKSVFLNAMIEQLMTIPNVELHLFDPKMVELIQYADHAKQYHSDHAEINNALEDLVIEMEERYQKMRTARARNIDKLDGIPYKFVVIDEFGDLVMNNKNVEHNVLLLAQKARAAGIHMIIATQRPSTDIIKGTIKANFPTKAVFRTAKEVDSRVILDQAGAEKLAGKGDMLFAHDAGIERLQGFNV